MKVTLFKRGRVWHARWRKNGRQSRQSLATENKKIAEELRVELEYRLYNPKRPSAEPEAPARMQMAALVDEYEAWSRANKQPKTVLNDQARIKAYRDFAKPEFVDEVTTASVMKFFAHRALHDSVSQATLLRHREILHALMTFAVRCGYVEKNPVSEVPRPKPPHRDPRFLSLDQIDELLELLEGDLIAVPTENAILACACRVDMDVCWSSSHGEDVNWRESGMEMSACPQFSTVFVGRAVRVQSGSSDFDQTRDQESGSPSVSVVEATEMRDGDYASKIRGFDFAPKRRIPVQCQVSAMRIVVSHVFLQCSPQVIL